MGPRIFLPSSMYWPFDNFTGSSTVDMDREVLVVEEVLMVVKADEVAMPANAVKRAMYLDERESTILRSMLN